MKRLLLLVLPLLLVLGSCTRTYERPYPPVDESYWLKKERGVVVYTGFNCNLFVVETRFGYTVVQNWGSFTPFRGAVLYGDFSRYGSQAYYNRSEGLVDQGIVLDYWLTYWQALGMVDYECRPI